MNVLLDIEWIEKSEKHLTQLSAVRIDENWNPVSSLEILVKPDTACLREPQHVAFGGISMELFMAAFPEEDCIRDFKEWLEPGDDIWVWAKSNKKYLQELWQRYLPEADMPPVQVTASKARDLASHDHHPGQSPYAILTSYGEVPPYPEHRASNDTEVMRRVFLCLGIAPGFFATPISRATTTSKAPMPKSCQRQLNLEMIERTGYNFVYLKNSQVFHRRTCKACLSAKSESDILGSVYYETAAKDRRPCRLCNPEMLPADMELAEKALEKKARKEAEAKRLATAKEIVKVKMLTGETIPIKRNNIFGWCHHNMHRGALNKALFEQHDCLGKNCPFLERNCQCSFWANLAAQQAEKAARKEKAREEKRQQAAEEEHLIQLSESWQSYLDDMESDMYIVRVAKDAPSVYRIFYVSDNRFADGNRYPAFLETLKFLHPHYRINLRHIRDVDGHFVTYDEYMSRARK